MQKLTEPQEEWGLMIQKYLIGSKMLCLCIFAYGFEHAPSVDDKYV